MKEQWQGFKGSKWQDEVDVRDFIQNNYKPYNGDESFLEGPTESTNTLWEKLQKLQKEERAKGGVLDMETEVVSSLTAYGPGYLDKDLEKVVGLQTDKPLKRAFMPYGGIRMSEEACETYGYKPSEKIKNFINSKLNVLYNLQINKKYDNLNKVNSAKLKALQGVSDLIYGKTSINKILQKKDKIAKKNEYSKSEYVAFFSYPSIPASRNYMPKDFFGEGTFKKFEDIEKVRVPANFEGYLTKVYGDYMKLPPEEKRVAHHYNEIIDLNKSYKEYERK